MPRKEEVGSMDYPVVVTAICKHMGMSGPTVSPGHYVLAGLGLMWDAVRVVVRDRCSRVRMKGIPWSDRPDSPPQRRRLRDRGQLRCPARMRD